MEKIYNYLMEEVEIKYGDAIVVGVSGGPDSMALLHLLNRIKKGLDIQLICAHVHHNIRKESDEEKRFVERFCATNGIVFEWHKIENYGDDNFHNEARSFRYNYFSKIVKKYTAKYLFTAHHGDDLIETILMRMVRGSTLRGYSGFSKIVDMGDYTIVRPFINITKNQIYEYNKKYKIESIVDTSNVMDIYTRNRFRKNVLPFLKKEEPMVHDKFYKFSKILLEYNDYIDKEVRKKLKKVYSQNVLNIEEYKKEESVIKMKIVYYILEQIYQDDLMLITDQHARLVYDLIHSKRANVTIHLPNNVKAIKSYDTFVVIQDKEVNNHYEIELINYMNLPNGYNIEVITDSKLDNNNYCRLDETEITMPLHVRTRHNGDKMHVKGLLGRKKINDIFIDEKIPVKERELWPIVVDSKGVIVWLPGLKKSKFDKSKDEKYDIILKYY